MVKAATKAKGYGSIGQRLRAARAQLGRSREEMAATAGIPMETYAKYERDQRVPGGDALAGLGLLGVDLTWLLTGRGGDELGLARAHSINLAQQLNAKYQTTESFDLIPLYDVRAAAGHGALAEDRPSAEYRAFSKVWLAREVGLPPARLKLITVSGDSMVPDLHDGEEVMIDTSDVEVVREGIYVFQLDAHIYVKRLSLSGDRLVITSRHGSQELNALKDNPTFRIIGRVVGRPRFDRL